MDQQSLNGKAQVSRSKRSRRPDPADQIISDARKPYMLHALQVMILRRSNNEFRFLYADDEGLALAVALCSLGSRKEKWDGVMPWLRLMPKPEREAFDQRVADFKPTLRNIAVAARLTRADREKYGREERRVGNKIKRPMQALLQLPIIDGDLEAERRDARNTARRKRWQEKRDAAVAKAADPRVQRRRQRDRDYMQAKRRSEGVMPRNEYLAASVAAAKPWEAFGIKRRAWELRGKPDPATTQVRRQQSATQVRRQSTPPKPLNHWDFPVTANGPDPKKDRGRTMTTNTSGKTAGHVEDVSGFDQFPLQAPSSLQPQGHGDEEAVDGLSSTTSTNPVAARKVERVAPATAAADFPATVCVDGMAQTVKAGQTVDLHLRASSNEQRERARTHYELRRLRRQLAGLDRRQVHGTGITTTKQAGASGR